MSTQVPASIQTRILLKAEIIRRVSWLSNDCSTFWRVRLELAEWCNKNAAAGSPPPNVGGGNFVMALAMLSACNFLPKAYSFLMHPEAFVTQEDLDKVKKAKATVEERCPELKALLRSGKTAWKPQREGQCNETEAFGRLIEALHQDGIDLGLPTTEARAVWDRFRNKLAHIAQPGGVVEVYTAESAKQPNEAKGIIQRGHPAFRIDGELWKCNADRLSLDVLVIADWLCKEVDTCTVPDRITKLAEWMFEDTDLTPREESDGHTTSSSSVI